MDIQDQPLQAQPSVPVVAAPVSAPSPAEPPTQPTIQLNAIPTEEHQTAFRSHKSLIIGVILAAIVVVSGLSVFIGFNNSSSQYQGFLQKIEAETEKLNADKAPTEQDVPEDGFGANSATALPELPLEPLDLAPPSTNSEDEGVAR